MRTVVIKARRAAIAEPMGAKAWLRTTRSIGMARRVARSRAPGLRAPGWPAVCRGRSRRMIFAASSASRRRVCCGLIFRRALSENCPALPIAASDEYLRSGVSVPLSLLSASLFGSEGRNNWLRVGHYHAWTALPIAGRGHPSRAADRRWSSAHNSNDRARIEVYATSWPAA